MFEPLQPIEIVYIGILVMMISFGALVWYSRRTQHSSRR